MLIQGEALPVNQVPLWLLRFFLAVLLLFGSEILLWRDPPGRNILEWMFLLVGYAALATLILDIIARYRVRGVYDLMMVAAVYGLLNGLLLNPETVFEDFPRTLMTRAIGGHTLLGMEMLGFFLALITGHLVQRFRHVLLGYALWVGFYWGVWVRWSPSLTTWLTDEVPLSTMLVVVGGVLLAALVLLYLLTQQANNFVPPDLLLSPAGWGILLVVLIGLFMVQVIREVYNEVVVGILAVLVIVALSMTILWFRRANKGRTVLDDSIPPRALHPAWIGATMVVFGLACVIAYQLPLVTIAGYNQLSVMELGFAAVGFLWLPLVAGVLGGQAFDRQMRKLNL